MDIKFCCILTDLTNSDIILIVTAIILFLTLVVIQRGNLNNARLNRLQAYENTIMKQLEFHNNMLRGIKISSELAGQGYGLSDAQNVTQGQESFEIFYKILKQNYKAISTNEGESAQDFDIEDKRIKDSFTKLYNNYGNKFGNYFKNLYLLIKYIDDLDMVEFKKDYFFDLVKSQLSKYELLLLAYDCIWIQNKSKGNNFIDFASKNNLFTAIEIAELISPIKHKKLFEERYRVKFGNQRE